MEHKTIEIEHVVAWYGLLNKVLEELCDFRDSDGDEGEISVAIESAQKVHSEINSLIEPELLRVYWEHNSEQALRDTQC